MTPHVIFAVAEPSVVENEKSLLYRYGYTASSDKLFNIRPLVSINCKHSELNCETCFDSRVDWHFPVKWGRTLKWWNRAACSGLSKNDQGLDISSAWVKSSSALAIDLIKRACECYLVRVHNTIQPQAFFDHDPFEQSPLKAVDTISNYSQ